VLLTVLPPSRFVSSQLIPSLFREVAFLVPFACRRAFTPAHPARRLTRIGGAMRARVQYSGPSPSFLFSVGRTSSSHALLQHQQAIITTRSIATSFALCVKAPNNANTQGLQVCQRKYLQTAPKYATHTTNIGLYLPRFICLIGRIWLSPRCSSAA